MFRFMISFAFALLRWVDSWGVGCSQNHEAGSYSHLILGPLFQECPHPGAFTLHKINHRIFIHSFIHHWRERPRKEVDRTHRFLIQSHSSSVIHVERRRRKSFDLHLAGLSLSRTCQPLLLFYYSCQGFSLHCTMWKIVVTIARDFRQL